MVQSYLLEHNGLLPLCHTRKDLFLPTLQVTLIVAISFHKWICSTVPISLPHFGAVTTASQLFIRLLIISCLVIVASIC